MAQINLERLKIINLAILVFLSVSCLFFSIYDLLVVKIWWSTAAIYFPCLLIFSFGIYSWLTLNPRHLFALVIIFLVVDLFLIVYGTYLWVAGEQLWGPVTLGFSVILVTITFWTNQARKELNRRHSTRP